MASGKIPKNWVLLWTNPSPNSDFVAQTVSIDLTNYETIAIASYDQGNSPGTFLFTKGVGTNVSWSYVRTWTGGGALYQRFLSISNNGVTFQAGRMLDLPSNSYNANYNTGTKPYKIYGIKY